VKYIYEFGDFRMDPAEQLLLRHGRPVALTPKVFETLLILVQSEGRLIEKDGFIRQLWPEVFVEEVTLAQNISQSRKALGDEKNGTSIIQTVHKRGYRFTPAVRKIVCDTSRLSDIANEEQANVVHAENQSATAGHPPAGLIHSQVALTARETPEPTPPPLLDMPESSRRRGFRILGAIVCIAIIVVVAGLVLRARSHRSEHVSGPSARTRMVPILDLPGRVSDPALSPNSEQIAFIWDGENAVRGDVYVHLIGGEKPLRLTYTDSGFTCCASWSPDGHRIAFGRCDDSGGAVFVVSALGGAERKVTSVACIYGNAGWPIWTADGKSLLIAAQCSPQGAIGIVLFSLATDEKRCLSHPETGDRGDRSPVLSPDGNTIAFIRMHSRTVNEICTIPVQGGRTRVVTSDGGSFWGLMWSSDGKRIIFRSPRQGINRIWKVSRDGGPVTAEGVYPEVGSQSHDGSRLAYIQSPGTWPTEAVRVMLSRPGGRVLGVQTLFASGSTSSALQPSPDDRELVFESDLAQDAGWTMEIWKSRSDGSDPLQLTNFHGHAGTPRWSPDGKSIAFDYRPGLRSHIYVMDSVGRNQHMVSSDRFEQQAPSWSRDGKSIYFTANNTGDWQVWRHDLASGEETQITHQGGYAAFESNDGKKLYYSRLEGGGIWTVPVNGGAEEQITDALHHGYWGHFSVVDSGIYFLDADAKPGPTILFYDFRSRRTVPVYTLKESPLPWGASLAASRNGLTLYFVQYKLTSSIALAENFQ
jgi:Tol biopolymer transport system component/DNA-binding winged helix-turn-helix (wHTH) protein